ncbi:isochorismatase family protein, partial [Pseudomonas aeruginosa]
VSTHWPWIGEPTRQVDGAHVALLAEVLNPVACKVGPEIGRDQLVLCGVYAHVGVLISTVDAYSNDIQPFLVADAIADFSEAHHRMALEYAASRCAMVVTTDEVLE